MTAYWVRNLINNNLTILGRGVKMMAVYGEVKMCLVCKGEGCVEVDLGENLKCPKCGGTGEDRPKTRSGMSTSYNNSQSSVAPRDEDE